MFMTKLICGPAKHTSSGHIAIGFYADGTTALKIMSMDGSGESEAIATLCLIGYESAPSIAPNQVWLKGYSENIGIPEALEAAGLVKLTGATFPLMMADAILAELSEELAGYVQDARLALAEGDK